MVNRLLLENRKSNPNVFNSKTLFKNVTHQILNFILINLIIKYFHVWCNVNFVSVFTAFNNTKKQRKLNIIPYGAKFYQLTYWDKIYHLEDNIFEKFFTTYILEWSPEFRAIDDLPHAH